VPEQLRLPGTVRQPPIGQLAHVCGPVAHHAARIECAKHLEGLGYSVIHNPVDRESLQRLRQGISNVLDADFLVCLPRWEFDRGSNVEVSVARALKLPVLDCGTLHPVWLP
jgi:hypothetical protein